jgi:hypothetical protein
MRRQVAVLALLLVVVASGCLTPFGAESSTPSAETPTGEDGGPGFETTPSNPWGTETLTVGVEHSAGPWRNVTGLVAETLDYWERNVAEYGAYGVGFELRPNASNPDIVVNYAEDISVCGTTSMDGGVGFAPVISDASPPDPPESICVRQGFTDASTRHILKHEFGHLLGISHGEPPTDLMDVDYEYLSIPRPTPEVLSAGAVESPVSVYVDRSTIHARRDYVAQQQLNHTIRYYERNANLVSDDPLDITLVESPGEADLVFSFPQSHPCEEKRAGSCAVVETQSDGRSQYQVAITTTHEDTYGWHAGYWLGIALGIDTYGNLPSPFLNASVDDRHADWWDDSP